MAVERADLSPLDIELMAAVPVASAAPGQSWPEDREEKPRHRPPPPEEPPAEPAPEEGDPPQHRIDSRA